MKPLEVSPEIEELSAREDRACKLWWGSIGVIAAAGLIVTWWPV